MQLCVLRCWYIYYDQHYCKVILPRWCLWSCKVSTIALFVVMFIVSCHPTKTHLWLTSCSCCHSIHQAVHCLHLWLWEWRKDLFCFSWCLPWWLLSTPGLRSLIKKWQLTTVSQIQLQAGHWWEKTIVVPKYSVIWCVVHKAYSAVSTSEWSWWWNCFSLIGIINYSLYCRLIPGSANNLLWDNLAMVKLTWNSIIIAAECRIWLFIVQLHVLQYVFIKIRTRPGIFVFGRTYYLVAGLQCIYACALPHSLCA